MFVRDTKMFVKVTLIVFLVLLYHSIERAEAGGEFFIDVGLGVQVRDNLPPSLKLTDPLGTYGIGFRQDIAENTDLEVTYFHLSSVPDAEDAFTQDIIFAKIKFTLRQW